MRRCTSQGASSGPVLTMERCAGTRQAPWRQASHISSQEASKATDRPAHYPVPGSERIMRAGTVSASASTNAAALAGGRTATPGGTSRARGEDDPRVVLRDRGGRQRPAGRAARQVNPRVGDDRADAGRGPHQLGAVVWVIDVDGNVGRPNRQNGEDGNVELGRTGGDADADPIAGADAHRRQRGASLPYPVQQVRVVQHGLAVVKRGRTRMRLRRGFQDLPQGPWRRRSASGVDGSGVDGSGVDGSGVDGGRGESVRRGQRPPAAMRPAWDRSVVIL